MFDWIVKTLLKAPIKASVGSTFLALAAIRLNIFFLLLCKFYFFQYSHAIKNMRKYAGFSLPPKQNKTMVPDNFKRNLYHFNVKEVEHVQLFHIEMKED